MTRKLRCHERRIAHFSENPLFRLPDARMTSIDVSGQPDPDVEEASLRSRASSVVTTGTKFSISTLPNEEYSHLDNVLGRPARSAATRPRSIFSVASYESSLPPYENPLAEEPLEPSTRQYRIGTSGQSSGPTGRTPSPTSPIVDPENALLLYGRVVRTIDQNHVNQMRRLKEAHQEELGATRHAIDQAYRQVLEARNREVERMREEMASLSAEHDATIARLQRETTEQTTEQLQAHQIALDKACNAIEDVWEARWNDRIRLADEEASKRNSLYQQRLNELTTEQERIIGNSHSALVERDKAWVQTLNISHPQLSKEIEDIASTFGLEKKT